MVSARSALAALVPGGEEEEISTVLPDRACFNGCGVARTLRERIVCVSHWLARALVKPMFGVVNEKLIKGLECNVLDTLDTCPERSETKFVADISDVRIADLGLTYERYHSEPVMSKLGSIALKSSPSFEDRIRPSFDHEPGRPVVDFARKMAEFCVRYVDAA